ncbi:hypothetical protein LQW54_011255 [Pestalotiopsis sp. IQ-011]
MPSHEHRLVRHAKKHDIYYYGQIKNLLSVDQPTKKVKGGFVISSAIGSIAVENRLKTVIAEFTKYEDFGLLETDAEDASNTTYEFGLGDSGDLAPVVQKDAYKAPKAFLHWDVERTELIIWQGEQWVAFKDSDGNVLVHMNLHRKKLPWLV